MNILLIGSGGREHALAWKLAQSHGVRLFCLPGNPGTARLGTNLAGKAQDAIAAARERRIDLVVIGPEAPLADGLADDLRGAGFLAFGPSKAAAQIEASKAFAKDFMRRHNVPSAEHRTFTGLQDALVHIRRQGSPQQVVIKASGLAAGKGVFLPDTLDECEATLRGLLEDGSLGEAGRQVVIEERLSGREVSLLAFTDGRTVLPMPPVQDHKRLMDGDEGPNTGGMGTFAPSPYAPSQMIDEVTRQVLQPAVDGLMSEGIPFCGVLYAGMILSPEGPRVLEFNCRFGDPETQVLMPLLDSDLAEICLACAQGRLVEVSSQVRWRKGAAACVVLASSGYPEKPQTGKEIHGLEEVSRLEDTWAFYAGVALKGSQPVSAGGRVLGLTAYGETLDAAIEKAYAGVDLVRFEGMHYRKDIGRMAAGYPSHPEGRRQTAYEGAGVSIRAGNRAVALIRQAVRSTFTPAVLSDVGAFGGLYHTGQIRAMRDAVLVASTDGIGTKVDLAARSGRFGGLGHDIVNHCTNDILVQGAHPLFFLDYIASGRLAPEKVAALVKGMSEACTQAGCALLGGETAEMPGVYTEGHFDVAGTIVGVVERDSVLPRADVHPGDVALGLASSGPHTNGYSLLRKIFSSELDIVFPELGVPLIDILLEPHRSYLSLLKPFLEAGPSSPVKALAHITGGGFIDNLPRVLPDGCGCCIHLGSWPVPPLFSLAQRLGEVDEEEMYHVFNMGIGMIAICAPQDLAAVQAAIPEKTWVIGEVVEGGGISLQ